jgi:predicted MFS family arabinose efflux permease
MMAVGLALLAASADGVTPLPAALLIAAGGGLFHPALIAHHAALLPEAPGRATASFYLAFDLGIGAGSWLLGFALQLDGLGGLYWCACALVLVTLPLIRAIAERSNRAGT